MMHPTPIDLNNPLHPKIVAAAVDQLDRCKNPLPIKNLAENLVLFTETQALFFRPQNRCSLTLLIKKISKIASEDVSFLSTTRKIATLAAQKGLLKTPRDGSEDPFKENFKIICANNEEVQCNLELVSTHTSFFSKAGAWNGENGKKNDQLILSDIDKEVVLELYDWYRTGDLFVSNRLYALYDLANMLEDDILCGKILKYLGSIPIKDEEELNEFLNWIALRCNGASTKKEVLSLEIMTGNKLREYNLTTFRSVIHPCKFLVSINFLGMLLASKNDTAAACRTNSPFFDGVFIGDFDCCTRFLLAKAIYGDLLKIYRLRLSEYLIEEDIIKQIISLSPELQAIEISIDKEITLSVRRQEGRVIMLTQPGKYDLSKLIEKCEGSQVKSIYLRAHTITLDSVCDTKPPPQNDKNHVEIVLVTDRIKVDFSRLNKKLQHRAILYPSVAPRQALKHKENSIYKVYDLCETNSTAIEWKTIPTPISVTFKFDKKVDYESILDTLAEELTQKRYSKYKQVCLQLTEILPSIALSRELRDFLCKLLIHSYSYAGEPNFPLEVLTSLYLSARKRSIIDIEVFPLLPTGSTQIPIKCSDRLIYVEGIHLLTPSRVHHKVKQLRPQQPLDLSNYESSLVKILLNCLHDPEGSIKLRTSGFYPKMNNYLSINDCRISLQVAIKLYLLAREWKLSRVKRILYSSLIDRIDCDDVQKMSTTLSECIDLLSSAGVSKNVCSLFATGVLLQTFRHSEKLFLNKKSKDQAEFLLSIEWVKLLFNDYKSLGMQDNKIKEIHEEIDGVILKNSSEITRFLELSNLIPDGIKLIDRICVSKIDLSSRNELVQILNGGFTKSLLYLIEENSWSNILVSVETCILVATECSQKERLKLTLLFEIQHKQDDVNALIDIFALFGLQDKLAQYLPNAEAVGNGDYFRQLLIDDFTRFDFQRLQSIYLVVERVILKTPESPIFRELLSKLLVYIYPFVDQPTFPYALFQSFYSLYMKSKDIWRDRNSSETIQIRCSDSLRNWDIIPFLALPSLRHRFNERSPEKFLDLRNYSTSSLEWVLAYLSNEACKDIDLSTLLELALLANDLDFTVLTQKVFSVLKKLNFPISIKSLPTDLQKVHKLCSAGIFSRDECKRFSTDVIKRSYAQSVAFSITTSEGETKNILPVAFISLLYHENESLMVDKGVIEELQNQTSGVIVYDLPDIRILLNLFSLYPDSMRRVDLLSTPILTESMKQGIFQILNFGYIKSLAVHYERSNYIIRSLDNLLSVLSEYPKKDELSIYLPYGRQIFPTDEDINDLAAVFKLHGFPLELKQTLSFRIKPREDQIALFTSTFKGLKCIFEP